MAVIIPVNSFDYVVFGGNGDLAQRKLLPSLYYRELDGQLPAEGRIIGVARTVLSHDEYIALAEKACREHVAPEHFNAKTWAVFRERLFYVSVSATVPASYAALKPLLHDDPGRARVFYFATAPDLFGPISRNLQTAGLVNENSRVVLEKPLGHDLESSCRINDQVGAIFPEERIFRIDHYLGKETVQNLMALRFANRMFERLWNAGEIDHIQITVAETLGVEERGAYYDHAGALRDMVQNHMLQLLCLIAMEPPLRFDADSVRDEKVKVLKALRPINDAVLHAKTVRGQYRAGVVDGEAVPGYLDEAGIARDSNTETFVVIKAEVENWRWAGVPFYLRTGKRMPVRASEIVVQFRTVPHSIFPDNSGEVVANRLVIRLQPNEGIELLMMTKVPGPGGMRLQRAPLNLSFAEEFKTRSPDAYERLLLDVVRGNPTLFMRRDEVEAAWKWIEPIMHGWANDGEKPRPYQAGTWGPASGIALIARDDRSWAEELP